MPILIWLPHLIALTLLFAGCASSINFSGLPVSGSASQAARKSISLTPAEAETVGRRIWQNESGGTLEGLTAWNSGEEFASLGIGHFIWYPANFNGPFTESFPQLLQHFASKNIAMPNWLRASLDCPWQTQSAFQRDFNSPRMLELRHFLASTIAEQALFAAKRMEGSLPTMLQAVHPQEKENIKRRFYSIANSAQGIYALVDYVNFKGEGTAPAERYNGRGWGLLQVLQSMEQPENLQSFANAARAVLAQRVKNAPPNRSEGRWLSGWYNRISTYAQ